MVVYIMKKPTNGCFYAFNGD